MTPDDFVDWRLRMNWDAATNKPLSERKCAALLGCSRAAVRKWSISPSPRYIGLACMALSRSLPPYGEIGTKAT